MRDKRLFIIFATFVFVSILYVIDQWLEVSYLIKSSIKIIMLFSIIAFYNWNFKINIIKTSIKNFRTQKRLKSLKYIGLILIVLIPIIYIFIRPNIDEAKILFDFENKYGITKDNFFFYGVYLSLINAMFEELFFRGFIFLELSKITKRSYSYFFSASAFAIYHLANINGWFNPYILGFTLFGLLIGGVLFNYLDEKNQTFLNSYFVHFCADVGIVIVGVIMFWGIL
jgi:membrane protease YdiL (CAAX protease family)